MQYLDEEGTVVYTSRDGATTRNFPALEWLAAMCSHISNRGEQMVRYYGYYSNVSRGKRQNEGLDDAIPCILEPQGNEKAFKKSWSRLIQKIYEISLKKSLDIYLNSVRIPSTVDRGLNITHRLC
jgi:hypothetical protein